MTQAQKTKAWPVEGRQIEAQGLGFLPKWWEYLNTSCGRMQEATVTYMLALAAMYTESISNGGEGICLIRGFTGLSWPGTIVGTAQQADSWKAQSSYSEVRTWQIKKLRRPREAKGPHQGKRTGSQRAEWGRHRFLQQSHASLLCPAVIQEKLTK